LRYFYPNSNIEQSFTDVVQVTRQEKPSPASGAGVEKINTFRHEQNASISNVKRIKIQEVDATKPNRDRYIAMSEDPELGRVDAGLLHAGFPHLVGQWSGLGAKLMKTRFGVSPFNHEKYTIDKYIKYLKNQHYNFLKKFGPRNEKVVYLRKRIIQFESIAKNNYDGYKLITSKQQVQTALPTTSDSEAFQRIGETIDAYFKKEEHDRRKMAASEQLRKHHHEMGAMMQSHQLTDETLPYGYYDYHVADPDNIATLDYRYSVDLREYFRIQKKLEDSRLGEKSRKKFAKSYAILQRRLDYIIWAKLEFRKDPLDVFLHLLQRYGSALLKLKYNKEYLRGKRFQGPLQLRNLDNLIAWACNLDDTESETVKKMNSMMRDSVLTIGSGSGANVSRRQALKLKHRQTPIVMSMHGQALNMNNQTIVGKSDTDVSADHHAAPNVNSHELDHLLPKRPETLVSRSDPELEPSIEMLQQLDISLSPKQRQKPKQEPRYQGELPLAVRPFVHDANLLGNETVASSDLDQTADRSKENLAPEADVDDEPRYINRQNNQTFTSPALTQVVEKFMEHSAEGTDTYQDLEKTTHGDSPLPPLPEDSEDDWRPASILDGQLLNHDFDYSNDKDRRATSDAFGDPYTKSKSEYESSSSRHQVTQEPAYIEIESSPSPSPVPVSVSPAQVHTADRSFDSSGILAGTPEGSYAVGDSLSSVLEPVDDDEEEEDDDDEEEEEEEEEIEDEGDSRPSSPSLPDIPQLRRITRSMTPSGGKVGSIVKKLTPKLAKLIDDAVKKGEDVKLTPEHVRAEIKQRDLSTLLSDRYSGGSRLDVDGWLNDTIVNAYMDLLKVEKEGVYAFSTQWFGAVGKQGVSVLNRWAKRMKLVTAEDVMAADTILFPLNPGVHWMVIAVRPKARTVEYLDSLNGRSMPGLKEVKTWLAEKVGGDWTTVVSTSNQQINSVDCGVFVCMNAAAIVSGRQPKEVVHATEMVSDARSLIAASLLAWKLVLNVE
jgi:sentrin-specific protease 1